MKGGGHSLAVVTGGMSFPSGGEWGSFASGSDYGGMSFASGSDWGGHSLAVVIGGGHSLAVVNGVVIRYSYTTFSTMINTAK